MNYKYKRTGIKPTPLHAKVSVSPGLALATRVPAVALGPQLRAGLLAP